jgi:hypothetical protein
MWDGHSCPSPLTLLLFLTLLLILILFSALFSTTPPVHLSQTNDPTLDWNSPSEKQNQTRRTGLSAPHPAQPKIRIPPQPPALSARRKKTLHHIPQKQSRPAPTASPRRRPATLPPRPRNPRRTSRRHSHARSRASPPNPIARRNRLAPQPASDSEIAQRIISPKRKPALRFERPSLAGRILRPRPKIARKFRRQTRIHPPKPSPPRPRPETRGLPLALAQPSLTRQLPDRKMGREKMRDKKCGTDTPVRRR